MGTVYNIAEMLRLQLHVSSDTFCCSFQVIVLEMRPFHLKTCKEKLYGLVPNDVKSFKPGYFCFDRCKGLSKKMDGI